MEKNNELKLLQFTITNLQEKEKLNEDIINRLREDLEANINRVKTQQNMINSYFDYQGENEKLRREKALIEKHLNEFENVSISS